jgi:large subunit ribosomal protein L28
MGKVCSVTGKKPLTGNNVSHSKRRTKRRQLPNLQKKRLLNPATGKVETIIVSARGLRTLAKWKSEGKKYDLREMKG